MARPVGSSVTLAEDFWIMFDRAADATRVDTALSAITQAQQLVLALNRDADAKATEALRALDGLQ